MDHSLAVFAEFAGVKVPTKSVVEHYSQKECVIKGLKAFGVCWGTALLVAVVPVIHLVVCPIAIIAGPIAGFFVFVKVQKLPKKVEGTVTCNHCQATTGFLFQNVTPPFYDMCNQCRTGYQILWPAESQPLLK